MTAPAAEWREDAACSRTDPGLWFDPDQYATAQWICRRCPVYDACLTWTTADDATRPAAEIHGVQAGLYPRARREAARTTRPTAAV